MFVLSLFTMDRTMWNEIKYRWEVFCITWLRWDAYYNRLNWDVIEPIKAVLYKRGIIHTKPLRLEVEELNAERHSKE